MYRTNHFDPCDFSIFDLGDPQSEICKIHTRSCAGFCIVFLHFLEKDIQQSVVFVAAGDSQMEQPVDLIYFL